MKAFKNKDFFDVSLYILIGAFFIPDRSGGRSPPSLPILDYLLGIMPSFFIICKILSLAF